MIQIHEKQMCCGCSACEQVCPISCIDMEYDEEGFAYPKVNEETCISCNKCKEVCPFLVKREKRLPKQVLGMTNLDDEILMDSSSGGVFGGIANHVIGQGGLVFGASYDNEHKVKHIGVEDKSNLIRLRHSKYVQSDINNTFVKAEAVLKSGKYVLFTGTPCQVSGLKNYLHKDYERLYLVDIICHGVPSPKVWERHLDEVNNNSSSNLKKVVFRDKENGWSVDTKYCFSDIEDNVLVKDNKDIYFTGFQKDIFLRPSCYNCQLRHFTSGSNITIGDFWGVEKTHPQQYKSKGVSCVMINDKKGEKLIEKIKDSFSIFESNIENVHKGNPNLFTSQPEPKIRSDFFIRFNRGEKLSSLIEYYCKFDNNIIAFGSYNLRATIHQLYRYIQKNNLQHFSYSSIISAIGEPRLLSNNLQSSNAFRREAVEHDFHKTFIQKIDTYEKDSFVFIDFLEERFNLIQKSGSFITQSEAYDELDLDLKHENIITPFQDARTIIWEKSCIKFMYLLKKHFMTNRIIIIENYLTHGIKREDGTRTKYLNQDIIDAQNQILKRYYNFIRENFRDIKIVSLSSYMLSYTDENFQYGCYEWHMNKEAYQDLAMQIYDYLISI